MESRLDSATVSLISRGTTLRSPLTATRPRPRPSLRWTIIDTSRSAQRLHWVGATEQKDPGKRLESTKRAYASQHAIAHHYGLELTITLRQLARGHVMRLEEEQPSTMPYKLVDDLIYVDGRGHGLPRLCIPPKLKKEVFMAVHDELGHVGFHRACARVNETLYMYKLPRRLRKYLEHCLEWQLRTPYR